MNRPPASAFLICGLISLVPGERKPEKLTLTVAHVAESGYPGENLYVINGVIAYLTVKGLKDYLVDIPKGSTLTWSPGCMRMGEDPLLDSAEALDAFKTFCDSVGTRFILVPSG